MEVVPLRNASTSWRAPLVWLVERTNARFVASLLWAALAFSAGLGTAHVVTTIVGLSELAGFALAGVVVLAIVFEESIGEVIEIAVEIIVVEGQEADA